MRLLSLRKELSKTNPRLSLRSFYRLIRGEPVGFLFSRPMTPAIGKDGEYAGFAGSHLQPSATGELNQIQVVKEQSSVESEVEDQVVCFEQ